MSGVLMRPAALTRGASMNADLIAVDGLARKSRRFEQRAQPDGVTAGAERAEPELGDHAILADQRHDVGEGADRGDLDERRQPLGLRRRAGRAPGPASARRRRRPGSCRDRCSRARLGLITAKRRRQRAFGLVVVGDDQIDAEFARALSAASVPRMPQSTETIRWTPSACSRSMAAGCRP